ncbi:MAG TPA: type IV pilus biogenesis/stability protein PilW, partial [Burkholderiaceae bacterium]|nr:type IV pilus biogenesis/stability protein PilW [Burkholderiaceae bacterium]
MGRSSAFEDHRGRRAAAGLAAFAVVLALSACNTTTTVNGVPVASSPGADGSGSPADAKRRAEVRLQLASQYYTQGQLPTAIDETNRALSIYPDMPMAYGLLGVIYMDLNDRAQADANFNRGLRMDPDSGELNNNYGWFLCRTGHERDSIRYFDRAAANRLYQTPAMPLQNAGVCLFQTGDLAAAETYLKRAFEADASSPVAKFQLARLYLVKGQLDRANFYYDLLQRSTDPRPDLLWLGVRIAHGAGDTTVEHQRAEELRRRFPESPEAA